MNAALLALTLSVVGADGPMVVAETGDRTARSRPSLFELDRELSELFKAETDARSTASHTQSVQALTQFYSALRRDDRLPTSPTLQRLLLKVHVRLRHIMRDVKRHARREQGRGRSDASLASVSSQPGAAGGRPQLANANALIELIQATIAPPVWDVNGGESTIRYFAPRHALVVRAPGEVHGGVRRVLGGLRRP